MIIISSNVRKFHIGISISSSSSIGTRFGGPYQVSTQTQWKCINGHCEEQKVECIGSDCKVIKNKFNSDDTSKLYQDLKLPEIRIQPVRPVKLKDFAQFDLINKHPTSSFNNFHQIIDNVDDDDSTSNGHIHHVHSGFAYSNSKDESRNCINGKCTITTTTCTNGKCTITTRTVDEDEDED